MFMTPPDPEWLLWAKRLRDEHKALLQQTRSNAEISAQIGPLIEQGKDLAASNALMQQNSKALQERVENFHEECMSQILTIKAETRGQKRKMQGLEKELSQVSVMLENWKDSLHNGGKKQANADLRPKATATSVANRTRAGTLAPICH